MASKNPSAAAPLRFIHLSDTHFGPTVDFELHGVKTYQRALAVVKEINRLAESSSAPFDFVVHTGDVATDGDETGATDASAALAAEVLGQLSVPLHIVNGNHDNRRDLQRWLPKSRFGQVLMASSSADDAAQSRASYWQYQNRLFVSLDARPWPIDEHFEPRGKLASQQLDALATLLQEQSMPVVLFLHYPPIQLDCRWIDDWMMVKYDDQRTLHDLLLESGQRIDGVFFGHVHRSVQVIRDGIIYAGVGSSSCHFDAWPGDDGPGVTACGIALFNYVSIGDNGTIVKQHWAMVDPA